MSIRPLLLLIALLLLSHAGVWAQTPSVVLRAGAFSAGTAAGQGTSHVLHSTLGQPLQGRLTGAGLVAGGGFWHQARPVAGPLALPIAGADAATTNEDTPVEIDVLANDVDPAGGTLTIVALSAPDHGSVLAGDGRITYTPEADFFGDDTFTYRVANEQNGTATAPVSVTVNPVNDAPAFTSDPVTGGAAGAAYRYTAEATDVDGDVPALTAPVLPAWLALTDHGDGTATLTGTPTNAEEGAHDVVLQASDGEATAEQPFTVTVILGAPATPALAAPEDGAVDVSAQPALVWNAVPGAATYDLQLATVEDFSVTVLDETGLSETSFEVSGLEGGTTYFWRVRAVNSTGAGAYADPFRFTTVTNVAVEDGAGVPERFALHQNYPNPFNPQTTIRYELPHAASVRLVVYDVLGQAVRRLVDEWQGAGRHEVVFTAGAQGSGVYLYRVEAGTFVQTRRMLLVK